MGVSFILLAVLAITVQGSSIVAPRPTESLDQKGDSSVIDRSNGVLISECLQSCLISPKDLGISYCSEVDWDLSCLCHSSEYSSHLHACYEERRLGDMSDPCSTTSRSEFRYSIFDFCANPEIPWIGFEENFPDHTAFEPLPSTTSVWTSESRSTATPSPEFTTLNLTHSKNQTTATDGGFSSTSTSSNHT